VKPRFFRTRAAFRKWLAANHDRITEQWVGFHKKGSGLGGLSYDEAVDEALCFGWIDGIIRRIDEESYMHRFTPRKPTSNWSAVNLGKMKRLVAEGLVAPAGEASFKGRDRRKDAQYSYERTAASFDAAQEAQFKSAKSAWRFWIAQPPGYRRTATHWVTAAKRPETRDRRLAALIEVSTKGQRLPQLI
jgi:uncharacterized protein YdeI (YjbR/CyaY-like superfamily)